MKTRTLSEYPGLIGEVLRRAEAREAKGTLWHRFLVLIHVRRRRRTHVVKFSPTEIVFSDR